VKVFTPANLARQGQNLVTVIRDGKREFYEVHDQALYDAITPSAEGHVETDRVGQRSRPHCCAPARR
jgi:hypothetical protein